LAGNDLSEERHRALRRQAERVNVSGDALQLLGDETESLQLGQ
jgi:hypothetical protein